MKNWNSVKFYDGESISSYAEKVAMAIRVFDCKESKIYIEEYSDIRSGVCRFKYEIYNYDLSPDILYQESEVSYMTLFDFIKDSRLTPLGVPTNEYIVDRTDECLEYYILHQRKN